MWKYLGILVAVVTAGLLAGWLGTGGLSNRQHGGNPSAAAGRDALVAGRSSDTHKLALRPLPEARTNLPGGAAPGVAVPNPSPEQANLITNWEDKLDEIFASEASDEDKVKQMFSLFPRVPEEGQVEVAQHLANLVQDEEYGALAQLLENPGLPEDVLDVLLADVLNRPNSLKMPALLAVAREPTNPKAGEARELLELFLDQDYGDDWEAWQGRVDNYLRENPD